MKSENSSSENEIKMKLLVSVYKHSIKKQSTFADEIFQDLRLNIQVCPMFNQENRPESVTGV